MIEIFIILEEQKKKTSGVSNVENALKVIKREIESPKRTYKKLETEAFGEAV